MDRPPVVTYIICNYNYSDYITRAIQSAQKQTYPCNLAIYDDASQDDSWEKIKTIFGGTYNTEDNEYYTKLSDGQNIALRGKMNLGPSQSRNILIDQTIDNTDYFAILDADDENYPLKIQKAVNILQNNPLIGIVYADYDIYNVDTKNCIREYKEPYNLSRLFQDCIIHSGSVVRKTALDSIREQYGWFDPRLRCAEDFDLWLRICQKSLAYHIPESLSLVRIHQNNSTNSVRKEVWEKCWQLVRQKYEQRSN
jgi:glycosyltransferase involved in cell wall biosynthesis